MFHFFEAIQNTKGDALIGYYVKAVDRTTGDVIDIYADNNATPIVSVSAVDNACLVDNDGDASFYVTAGTYHVDIYATDAVTFIRRVNDWPMTLDIDAVISGSNTGDQTIELTGDVTGSGTGTFAATIGANKVTMAKFVAASGAGIVAASGAGNYAETAPAAARTILDVPSNSDMTAAIAAVSTGGGGSDQPLSQVIAGLGIAWTGSLNFTMSAGSYYINGTVYTAAEQSITLSAADGSNDRIDVLAVDTTGTLVKINGTAAANPSQPDVDPATQLYLKFVYVPAGATAPVISADEIVFEENDGVGEWTGAVLSGTSVVVNSTSEPDSGTVCIAGTSAGSSAPGVIRLNKGSTISVDTLDSLVIRFKSKTSSWGTGQVRIHLQTSAGVRVGVILSIRNGSYGLTTSNTSTYQTLTIPITAFAIPAGTNLQYLQIADNTGAAISWRMDNIKLKKSSTATGGTSNGITQTQGDARYAQRANNLSDLVSASTARTNLGLAIGTNVQAFDADLSALAALSGTNTIYYRSAANTWTAVTIGANLTFSGGSLAASSGASTGERTLVPPVATDYTLQNAGTASIATVSNGIKFLVPSSSDNVRFVRHNAGPASLSSFTIIVKSQLLRPGPTTENNYQCLIVLRNATSGKLNIYGNGYKAGSQLIGQRCTGYTGLSSTVMGPSAFPGQWAFPWQKLVLSGGNINYFMSPDGINWWQHPTTDTLAANIISVDEVGVGCVVSGSSGDADVVFQSIEIS